MSSCCFVFMFSRKSGTLRPTFLRKPEMPRTTWCVPFSFSHFFHVFIFSGVSLRGSHIAEGSLWKFSLFPFYCLFNELNITISSGLHFFTKNRSYYPACTTETVPGRKSSLHSKSFQSNYCAKVGSRERWIQKGTSLRGARLNTKEQQFFREGNYSDLQNIS